MKNNIITISRQFGSGGRTVGKEVAEMLGIPCYDSELITKIAEESGFAKEYIAEHGEYTNDGGWFAVAFGDQNLMGGPSNQDIIWLAQCKVICELAEKGPCVFVGRCADYILREKQNCLRIFIHADDEQRAKRIVEQYGEKVDKPQKRLEEKDKRRAAYYRIYTDQKFGDVRNFDLTLNSGTFGIDACATIIAEMFKHAEKAK